MALDIIELLSDDAGEPKLGSSTVKFKSAGHGLLNSMSGMSAPTDCRQMVFIELPVGLKSATRSPDRDQTAVVLTGALRISAGEGEVRHLKAGEVFRLPQARSSLHTLEVVGDDAVQLMVLLA